MEDEVLQLMLCELDLVALCHLFLQITLFLSVAFCYNLLLY